MSAPEHEPLRRPARRHGAVGAVVVDERRRILLLERDVLREGRWVREVRLPKGPLQPRETDAEAARAEVVRLTGYDDLEVVADLGKSPVEYRHRGVRYRRTEHYFLLRLRSLMKADPAAPRDGEGRLYEQSFVTGFADAARRLSFESEQGAVLRARAWWPG
jgi:hypothetical protein